MQGLHWASLSKAACLPAMTGPSQGLQGFQTHQVLMCGLKPCHPPRRAAAGPKLKASKRRFWAVAKCTRACACSLTPAELGLSKPSSPESRSQVSRQSFRAAPQFAQHLSHEQPEGRKAVSACRQA